MKLRANPDSDVEEFDPLAIEGLNLEELQSAFEIETVSEESEPTLPESSTSPLASSLVLPSSPGREDGESSPITAKTVQYSIRAVGFKPQ